MTQTATQDPQSMVGAPALDENGEPIGQIRGIYLQNGTRQPEWAAVEAEEGDIALVPLLGATPTEEGVWLPVSGDDVLEAPARHTELPRQVFDDEAEALYRHYGGSGRRATPNGSSRTRGRRRTADATSAAAEVPAQAAQEGRRVATTAAEQSERVASTVAAEGKRVASTAVQGGHEVARTAAGQVNEIAGTAREQAGQVSAELTNQARTFIEGTRNQVQGQVQNQTQMLSDSLRRLGEEAKALAEGRPDQAGPLADYVTQAGERLATIAKEIEARGPEGLVDDLKSFAKSRPGTFVLGAAVAGFGIGRLVRSAGGDEENEISSGPTGRPALAGTARGAR